MTGLQAGGIHMGVIVLVDFCVGNGNGPNAPSTASDRLDGLGLVPLPRPGLATLVAGYVVPSGEHAVDVLGCTDIVCLVFMGLLGEDLGGFLLGAKVLHEL